MRTSAQVDMPAGAESLSTQNRRKERDKPQLGDSNVQSVAEHGVSPVGNVCP
jgi:hypothetical protein